MLAAGLRAGAEVADLAAGFHAAVIRATAAAAADRARAAGISVIGLTGGVFANRLLLQGLRAELTKGGFEVLSHRTVPCNDGGLALGQATIAAATARLTSLGGTNLDISAGVVRSNFSRWGQGSGGVGSAYWRKRERIHPTGGMG